MTLINVFFSGFAEELLMKELVVFLLMNVHDILQFLIVKLIL